MKQHSVLVAGATGLVGGYCMRLLLADDRFSRIVVLGRRPLMPEFASEKVEEHLVDFDDRSTWVDKLDVDTIICTLGTTIAKAGSDDAFKKVDYTYPLELAREGLKHGAEHFLLVSSIGADPLSRFLYYRTKGELEEAVLELHYQSISILRPSMLRGKRGESRPLETIGKALMWLGRFALPSRLKPIHAHTVASVIVHLAATAPKGNRTLESDEIRDVFDGIG